MDRDWQLHERVYVCIGVMLVIALLLLAEWKIAALPVAGITFAYSLLIARSRCGGVPRLIAAYIATWALYAGSTTLVQWLRVPVQSEALLRLDAALFGQTPAVMLQGALSEWQADLLAIGYMSYHVYLHWVLLDALRRDAAWRIALSEKLFLAFSVGFVGYLVFPAAPPATAFPELFTQSLPGGLLSRWNEAINASMAARFDAFPSLHALITATLLAWDWRHARWRFRIMLAPSLLMLAATLALRLHYAVDLLASAALFIILTLIHARIPKQTRSLVA